MGGDCCGVTSGIKASPVDDTPQLEGLKLENGVAHTKGAVQAPKKEGFSAEEFKAYVEKRVNLFLQYKERQEQKVIVLDEEAILCEDLHHDLQLCLSIRSSHAC